MLRIRIASSSLVAILFAAIVAVPLASTSQAATTRATCSASQAAVTLDGKRTCVARGAMKQIAQPTGDATWAAKRMLGLAGVRPTQVKLKPGATLTPTLTTAEAKQLVSTTAQMEQIARKAALDALKDGRSRRGGGTGRAVGDVVISTPTLSVTQTSRSAQAKVTLSAAVDQGDGKSTKLTMDMDARRSGDAEAVFQVGLDIEQNDRRGVTTGGGTKVQLLGGKYDTCPSITGEVRYNMPASVTSNDRLLEKLGPVELGHVNRTRTTKSMSKASVVMNADATLPAIPFSITVTARQTFDAKILAVSFGNNAFTAVATARGTLDPKTGLPSSSTVFDVRTVGGGGGADPAVRGKLARETLAETRELMGKMTKHFREVETRARGGECTSLQFDPASGAVLAKGGTKRVEASLRSKEGNQPIPTPVSWTVTPALGKVTPLNGKTNGLPTTVTAAKAASGGVTARITYKAVSRAGISTAQWTGTETTYPKTYSGTFSYDQSWNGVNEQRAGTVTYALESATPNPDGSTTLWYRATGANITSAAYSDSFGGVATIVLGTNTILSGDLEILVSSAGAWKGAMQIDIDMGRQTITYPPPIPPSHPVFKAVFNSRTEDSVPQLRPMTARGPLAGTLTFGTFGRTGTGTWQLDPHD